ncbi:hypothetical protein OROMI_003006 [Orobanche minor]
MMKEFFTPHASSRSFPVPFLYGSSPFFFKHGSSSFFFLVSNSCLPFIYWCSAGVYRVLIAG